MSRCPPGPPPLPLRAPPADAVYLKPQEVAELLRLSLKRVYALASEDASMPVLRVAGSGSALRFPREALERWLAERTQGRPPIRNRMRAIPNLAPHKEASGG
jgi:excisionase family DNA binding protein